MSGKPFVRRDIWSLPANDPIVTSYAKAVEVMQNRPATDQTSWAYQAAIHGSQAPSPPPLANQCQHQGWYFIAWHRMYLYYFERIVRAAVVQSGGPSDWALPYWNYGLNGRSATLPLPFRNPPTGLPALNRTHKPGINTGATIPPLITSPAKALARLAFTGAPEFGGGKTPAGQFEGSTGRIEQTPHNDIHNAVGGMMLDPDEAALDPIFWLHHSNIDRLWAVWIGMGGGRVNTTDPTWTGQAFSFFDENRNKVTLTCGKVQDTIADLGYTYDPAPAPTRARRVPAPTLEAAVSGSTPTESQPELVGASDQPVSLTGTEARVTVPIDRRARTGLLAGADAPATPRRVFLNVEDIDAERNPGTVYGVFVNLPEGAPPDVAELHHAGNVSFFGIERAREPRGDEHSHGLRVALEITDLVRALAESGQWDDETLDVTFQPLDLIPPEVPDATDATLLAAEADDPPVRIGRVSVFYA